MWSDPSVWAQVIVVTAIVALAGWLMYEFIRDEVEHARYSERRAVVHYLRNVAEEGCDIAQLRDLPSEYRKREAYLASAIFEVADEISDGDHREVL